MPPIEVAAGKPLLARAREDVATARQNAAGATTVPALRAEVNRLANVIDLILDELERSQR